ncbi:tyrosine phosphatase [Trichoderma citrinoviride]|uniref:Tyrosine phosphatase n=1 Tax=Trichoderma citrinoviride TaxID=58853 RepID=A0A2T4BIS3_9HYPO|nr:tyrosine phosphatase [Trichoderma citrinoviride]PTB69215.1 tyrosine phosphatase [Trichoderma citrinoviride]
MDKIPKFRRKPKPPVLETAIDRNGSVASDKMSPNDSPQRTHHKMAPFRSLRLRGPSKRARDSPPSDLTPTTPSAVVVAQDGIHTMCSRPANHHAPSADIDAKYQELTWAERVRVAQGMRDDNLGDPRWALYKHADTHDKMDRYINIRPWAHNRVKLRVPESEFDYVNASAISLTSPTDPHKPPLHYLAMQGPTVSSFDHVWRMIAEQCPSPAVIVQLTNLVELDMVKCDQYFPMGDEIPTGGQDTVWSVNEYNLWGDNWRADLTFVSVEELAGGAIEKRKLLLHVHGEQEPRVVWHFLYRRWPDFGVPTAEDVDSFLELMRLSREHTAPSAPRVIHCSAGVGRTGTFICLEHLMRELDSGALARYDMPSERTDLVCQTVDTLRQQRRGMVQGEIQYRFIYQVLRKLWHEKYGGTDGEARSVEPAAKRLEVASPFTGNFRPATN